MDSEYRVGRGASGGPASVVQRNCWELQRQAHQPGRWQVAGGDGLPPPEQEKEVVYKVKRENPRVHSPSPGCLLSPCCEWGVDRITARAEVPSTAVTNECYHRL